MLSAVCPCMASVQPRSIVPYASQNGNSRSTESAKKRFGTLVHRLIISVKLLEDERLGPRKARVKG